tara:strand:+ start:786 stop:2429 length:1644 start_codon:yes stop_codon:yes gene_type:complete
MPQVSNEAYLGNPNLKRANTAVEFTKEQVLEFDKCMADPSYFVEKWMKIVSLDEGLVPFKMYSFQKGMIDNFHKNRFSICKLPRQSGKTTIIIAYILHYIVFNENVNIAILANKSQTARDILGRLQLAYENLPKWMQQGILNWNKGSLELENNSKIVAAATSSSAIRGGSYNMIFLDEFAFVPQSISEQFFNSVYPTITSGKTTKVIIVSTPHGMNMFYKMWTDSVNKNNDYVPIEVHWSEVPGRDEDWKKETIRNTSKEQFAAEFECEFVGSIDTLINPTKLKSMPHSAPIKSIKGLSQYVEPKKNHEYVITVDVSRGVQSDYSAFIVFDATKMPYHVVAKYRNNEIKPLLFPNIIEHAAKLYNHAHTLIEVNDIGGQVADAMQFDLEYDNLMMTTQRGRAGQVLGAGFSGRGSSLGVRMTKSLKKIGCSNLKTLIESDKLITKDFHTIQELSTFIKKHNTWAAEEGCNDDLVTCLIIFGWLSNQPYFKELTDTDVRSKLYEEQEKIIEQDMAPFGFIDDGITKEEDEITVDEYGDVWHPAVRKGQ